MITYISASTSIILLKSMRRIVLFLRNNMAAWRANTNSSHSHDEDTCSSCFDSTRYCCLHCQMAICNKCSVFEENEDTGGWVAGKSVSYCEPCSKELKSNNNQITIKAKVAGNKNCEMLKSRKAELQTPKGTCKLNNCRFLRCSAH